MSPPEQAAVECGMCGDVVPCYLARAIALRCYLPNGEERETEWVVCGDCYDYLFAVGRWGRA